MNELQNNPLVTFFWIVIITWIVLLLRTKRKDRFIYTGLLVLLFPAFAQFEFLDNIYIWDIILSMAIVYLWLAIIVLWIIFLIHEKRKK